LQGGNIGPRADADLIDELVRDGFEVRAVADGAVLGRG
jgi:hypothetical protein